MISAGRVLIKPCGEWNPTTTYHMLDLVNHNGYAYLAKRTVVGIEPNVDPECWHNLLDINKVIEGGISESLADDVGKLLEERFADLLSEARYVTDLFADFDVPTFVRWNISTANTPYKAGITPCYEGYALVFGNSINHTVSAWAKGGIRNDCFMHTVSEGKDYGWDNSISASGGTMTGSLMLHADPVSDSQAATKRYVDGATLESYFAFCTNANEDSILCALGKNNEDRIRMLGLQLAMYAWFKGESKTDYPFTELSKCDTLAAIPNSDSAWRELCYSDFLRNYLLYNEYARESISDSETLMESVATSEPSNDDTECVEEIDFAVTQEMLNGEDLVVIDYEVGVTSTLCSAELFLNGVRIAVRSQNNGYAKRILTLDFKKYNITTPGVYKFKSVTQGHYFSGTGTSAYGYVYLKKITQKLKRNV